MGDILRKVFVGEKVAKIAANPDPSIHDIYKVMGYRFVAAGVQAIPAAAVGVIGEVTKSDSLILAANVLLSVPIATLFIGELNGVRTLSNFMNSIRRRASTPQQNTTLE